MKKKILIISGGISKERIISLDTGKQVSKELINRRYKVKITEPDFKLLEIVKSFKPDIIFNALHGQFGEDGYIQTILEGFKKSVEEFKKSVADVSSQDIMRLALAAQYFDMLKEVGSSNKGHVIFMDSSGNKDFNDILKEGLISAEFAKDNLKKK